MVRVRVPVPKLATWCSTNSRTVKLQCARTVSSVGAPPAHVFSRWPHANCYKFTPEKIVSCFIKSTKPPIRTMGMDNVAAVFYSAWVRVPVL